MPYDAAPDRYDTTEYARVGRSGLRLPKISLGLWNNFGYDRPLTTQRAILRRAFDLGITHIDIANNYGPRPVRQRATSAPSSPRTSRPTATSSSSPARPGTTCGTGRTRTGAAASTC